MPRRSRRIAESGIYHVMLRAVNRDPLFLDDTARTTFLRAVEQMRDTSGCAVLAYCLMSNHVHLVLETGDEPIGAAVKRLGVRYAWWFNHRYGRVGHLFQDRFLSRPVEDDAYFVTLIRYVWDNPVKAGLVTRPEDYPWSSCRFFGGASPLVDDERLGTLLPRGFREWDVPDLASFDPPAAKGGRPRLVSGETAATYLASASGARTPREFLSLDRDLQRSAVRALRQRCVPFSAIAEACGLSLTSVKRLHVAAQPPR